jgi:hypothetical protein
VYQKIYKRSRGNEMDKSDGEAVIQSLVRIDTYLQFKDRKTSISRIHELIILTTVCESINNTEKFEFIKILSDIGQAIEDGRTEEALQTVRDIIGEMKEGLYREDTTDTANLQN